MVVAIIALLISMLLPSMKQARELAIRVKCASQLKQIMTGTFMYTTSNAGLLPARPGWGAGNRRPHTMVDVSLGVDLNKTFIQPYITDDRDLLFCPSRLLEVRNPATTSPNYTYVNVTYQYHLYDTDNAWVVERPDLSRAGGLKAGYGVWSCLTVDDALYGYFGHDRPLIPLEPDGLNSALTDGSARWFKWEQCEAYIGWGSQLYLWPKSSR